MREINKTTGEDKARLRPRTRVNLAPQTLPTHARANASLRGLDEADLAPDVRAAVTRLIGEVDRLNDEAGNLHSRIGELESLADTDPLLPVYNRRAFTRELKRAMAMARRHGLAGALVLVDLDDFKVINDTFGHPAGDAVLHEVARVLNNQVRETDIVGRLGGDEFGVMLAAADEAGAATKAASLVEIIREQDFVLDGRPMRIGASAGVQCFGGEQSAAALIKRADEALYQCKKAKGRAA